MSTKTIGIGGAIVQSAVEEVRSVPKTRLLYIDNIRILLISMVVLVHLSATYGFAGDWDYHEVGEVSPLVFFLVVLLQAIGTAFAMGLFFLIAGYFSPRAYDSRGSKGFLLERFKRLGIPLVLFEIVLNPPIHYAVAVHEGEFQGSFWSYLPFYPTDVGSFGDGPVWFLVALLIFSVCYALWRIVTGILPARSPKEGLRKATLPGNGAIALFALTVGLITFVVRIWSPWGHYLEPWHLEPAHFPQYISMFVIGILAFRSGWSIESFQTQTKTWRWIALLFVLLVPVLAVAAGALTGSLDERGAGGLNWLSLAYSIWEGFMCIAMSITVLALFAQHFNRQGRLARTLSDNCFAVYVLHSIVIIPLALALSDIHINLGLKFLLVTPVAMTLCYLVAYYFRKIPLVRSIL
jgi:glucans biosynthesis protein C